MESSDRFFRPPDTQATRRNYRRIQVRRILAILSNAMVVVIFALVVTWVWQTTQRDARFAIREVSATGAVNTTQASIDEVVEGYVGANLFQLDIESLKRDLLALPWVGAVAIEKELPGRLVVHLTERVPEAIVSMDGTLRYADATGVVFADVDPRFGSADLPIIVAADGRGVAGCVAMLEKLEAESPELYSRISEITPADGETFKIWDRQLGTDVYLGENATKKWMTLYAIASREGFGRGTIEYVDLRFEDRVIVRPRSGVVPLHEAEAATETVENGGPSGGSGRPGNA